MSALLDKPLDLPVRDIRAAQLHDAVKPLMDELGHRNHVRVVKVTALPKGHGREWSWSPDQLVDERALARRGEMIHDSRTDNGDPSRMTLALLPELIRHDTFRMLGGKKPIFLDQAIRLTGGELRSITPNLRTTIGIDYVADALGGSRTGSIAQYIALSNCTGTPTASDTTATTGASGTGINWGTANATDAAAGTARGEYTALGLARASSTYAHTNGVASYTFTHTFTASSAITAVQACALSNNATQGVASSLTSALFVENTFTPTSLANTDQLTILWTINI